MKVTGAPPTRPYRQQARARTAAATRERIARAAIAAFAEGWWDETTLREIAGRAGVSVQTVVNHFSGKDGLLSAIAALLGDEVTRARAPAVPGDTASIVEALIDDYERTGDLVVHALAQEGRDTALAAALAHGRAVHRAWVEHVFADRLPREGGAREGGAREAAVALHVVATDVSTWKLLRRDQGLSRQATVAAVTRLLDALAGRPPPTARPSSRRTR